MNQPPPHASSLFRGRHFDRTVIILCVRWYITYKLSYRDLVEMTAERGADVSHTTILRWVQRFVPEFEKRWNRYARPVGTSWRADETYIKVRGRWAYLYRAVDKQGLTVDFMLGEHGDVATAKRFFTQAIGQHGAPARSTLDGYPATHTAVAELKMDGVLHLETKVWASKYWNNIIEQAHRRVRHRAYPTLGLMNFRNAAIAISGTGLAQKIRKGQSNIIQVKGGMKVRMPQVWDAVLAG